MKLPTTSYRVVAIIALVVSVIGLIMSPVSAATAFSPSGDPAGTPAGNTVYHHTFNSTQQAARLQTVLANLTQQGVDTSTAQADLAAGNVTAAFQWLMAYHNDHPDSAMNTPRQHAVNATAQTARLQSRVTKLGQQGVDVSGVQADLASGNMNAAMQWIAAYHTAHPNANGTSWHGGNSTRWQKGSSLRPHHAHSGNQTTSHPGFTGAGNWTHERRAGA
jgi:hypothetical protein